ncbi:B1 protein-like [Anoplophora glabripennis]|uniref:B1 protein-like n=1 Tax=Anoplophora glabripennis TaxID=217634 RepID=UPI00087468B3|nr:B1 protein-like [Anoplophora glabripennis]
MSVKVVFVLTSVLAVVWAQELSTTQIQVIMNHHKECKAETNIDDSLASGVLAGNFSDDPVLKQYLFCMNKRLGILNDSGEIQKDAMKEKLGKLITDEAKIEELTNSCSVEKSSPEDTALELTKCIYQGTHP